MVIPQAEDIFTESFSATLNGYRKNDNLIGPGDVVVLKVSPWMASDDTIFGTKSLEKDEELGMQIVVETSIVNHNAELPPSKRERDNPLATCHDSDLQPLASVALKIHKKLAESNFVELMIEWMKSDEALGERQVSPFYFAFEDDTLAEESQVVTSWTIKTDIEAGSSIIDMDPMSRIHVNVLYLAFFTIIALIYWGFRPWLIGKRKSEMTGTIEESDQPSRESRRRKYARGSANKYHPTDACDSIMATDAPGGRSVRSIGSLGVYFAKTSKFPRKA